MSETNTGTGPGHAPPRIQIPIFVPEPYTCDGGFSSSGLATLLVVVAVAGAALGCFASWIGQWFYLVMMFPVIIGLGVGGIGKWGIRRGKVRSPMLGGLAGLIGGGAAVVMMHGTDYLRFRSELDEFDPAVREVALQLPEYKAKREQLDPDTKELVDELAKDPELVRALQVTDLWTYIDYSAEQGVTITSSHGRNDKGTNLGYVGSYIYWGVELLILVGVSFAIMVGAASEPFCAQCETWKQERVLGGVSPPADEAVDSINQGDLSRLLALNPMPAEGGLQVSVAVCPNCGKSSRVDVKLDQLTYSKKGELKTKKLTRVRAIVNSCG